MTKPVAVEDSNFEEKVLKSPKPVLVDFWATWCKPCLAVAPIIDDLAEEYGDRIEFVKLDVDENMKTAATYSVRSIPTILIFKDGKPVSHTVGLRPKSELKQNLDSVL